MTVFKSLSCLDASYTFISFEGICHSMGFNNRLRMTQFEIECRCGGQSMGIFRFFNCGGKIHFTVSYSWLACPFSETYKKMQEIFFQISFFSSFSFIHSSLLYINGELPRGGSVAVVVSLVTGVRWQGPGDMWHVTCDRWHVTHDTWNMTHDTWHMTHDTRHFYLIFKVIQSEEKKYFLIYIFTKGFKTKLVKLRPHLDLKLIK